ncbi:MAG: ABC transporter substrate-binding protein [Actinomycetota bacterium]
MGVPPLRLSRQFRTISVATPRNFLVAAPRHICVAAPRNFLVAALLGSVAIGCSGGSESVETTVATTIATTTTVEPTTTTTIAPAPMFGDLPSPCGPADESGVPTIAEGQNGAESVKLGVANDHGFAGADNSTIEMLDSALAFAAWCNAQGGIRGLPIEIIDLDAAVTGVPLAMERACADVFALVGGGWTLDDQMFPRFHECGLVSIPAFTATAAAAMGNGKAQPIPNPIDRVSTTWLRWIADSYRDAVDDVAIVHADLPAVGALADRLAATMQLVDGFGEPTKIAYDPAGSTSWSDIVRQLAANKITAVSFIGDPSHLVSFATAMNAANFVPGVVFGESNLISPVITESAEAGSLTNLRISTIHAPLSESESSPAISSYLDMMRTHSPDGRIAGPGLNSVSAMLLFATAANSCLDSDNNVLERECVLTAAKGTTSWTAGGLHAATNPSENSPSPCTIVMGIDNGSWSRVFPLLGSSDDNANGWFCDDESIVPIVGDFGDTSGGIDPSRLN